MISPGSIFRRSCLFAAFWLSLAVPHSRAIVIYDEGPENVTGIYDRFNVGTYPSAPVENLSFIAAALDLSGIGWLATNSSHSLTLISPQYVIAAAHNFPGNGSTLQFLGTDGSLYSATIQSRQTLTYTGSDGPQFSDLTVGRLTNVLPAEVTPMPIFYLGADSNAYLGLPLLNYGRNARMGTNILDEIAEFRLTANGPQTDIGLFYDYDAAAGETLLEGGDSGSPTLAFRDGAYGLIGTHSGVDTPNQFSADAFVPYTPYLEQINALLAADNQALTFAAVPEPDTIMLGAIGLGMCATRRVRRARRRPAGRPLVVGTRRRVQSNQFPES